MVTRLNAMNEAVLLHVSRFRLTVPDALAHTALCDSGDRGVAHGVLERLRKSGYLDRAELCPEVPGTLYYQLTAAGARRLGHHEEFARPLKRGARLERFAMLQFCCSGPVLRELFTKVEFQTRFRVLWYPGQPVQYYLEPDGDSARLAFIKVDVDGAGRWDRLIDSCHRFLYKRTNVSHVAADVRRKAETFTRLVTEDKFQFSVLTTLPEKKRAIELELNRRMAVGEPAPPIRVYVVPALFDIVFHSPISAHCIQG